MLAETAVVAVILLLVFNLRGPNITQLQASIGRAKTLLKDSWPLLLSGIAITVYMKIDQIMLGQMIGDEAVGIYSAAVRISEVWYFISVAIVASVFPTIIEAKKRSDVLYYALLQKLYDLMAVVSVLVALAMTLSSGSLITMLFGTKFSAAGAVLAIHIWAGVFVFLGVASGNWFIAENLQKLAFQRTVYGAVANILLNLLLIPKFGVNGAAVALVISQAIACWIFDGLQKVTRHMFFMKLSAMNPARWHLLFLDKSIEVR
jgi:PST family polysaccharide transporter